MKKYLVFSCLFFISGISSGVSAETQSFETRWERSSAMAAVESVDIAAAVYGLSNISALADGQSTLEQLKQLENRADWPLPAREAAIYRFTRSRSGRHLPSMPQWPWQPGRRWCSTRLGCATC